MDFIRGKGKMLCFAGYAAVISVLELLAYWREGVFSVIAYRLWLLSGGLCLALFLWEAGKQAVSDIKNRKVLLPAGFLLIVGIYLFFIGNLAFSDVSFEATQQVAEGLASLKVPDGNYTKTGFLGYPNRQYVLNALPAALFGRNLVPLQLGFALPFLIGITALFLELRAWLRQKGWWEETALLPVASFLTLPYVAEYYRFYEQTINPVAFGMLGVALLLRLYRKTDVWGVFAITWVGCMCCNLYTPALAFFGFLLFFLVLLGWGALQGREKVQEAKPLQGREKVQEAKPLREREKAQKAENLREREKAQKAENLREREKAQKAKHLQERENGVQAREEALETAVFAGTAAACMCVFFLARQITGGNTDIGGIREGVTISGITWKAWMAFFLDLDGQFWGIHLGTVLLYLVLALTGQLKFRDFLTAGWVLLTVSSSRLFAGYTTYQQVLENQRDMVILPVIVVAVFFTVWEVASELSFSRAEEKDSSRHPAKVREKEKDSSGHPAKAQASAWSWLPIKNGRAWRKNGALAAVFFCFLLAGYRNIGRKHHVFTYYGYVQPLKYAIAYTEEILDEKGLCDTMEFNWVVYTDNLLQRNLWDYACFFYPNAHCFAPEPGKEPEGLDASLPTIILSEQEGWAENLGSAAEQENLGSAAGQAGGAKGLGSAAEQAGGTKGLGSAAGQAGLGRMARLKSRTWQNTRYSSEVTWYWYPQE